jgi:uncharacterized protein YndB with AHSA1/START domain
MTTSITLDQFIRQPPAKVWQALTEPELLARWWVPGDIAPVVGHEFLLEMRGWGQVPCTVLEVAEPELLVYSFHDWTLTWRLVAEGAGTRLLLEHAGFDLDDPQQRFAFDEMGPGWRDVILPRIDAVLADSPV